MTDANGCTATASTTITVKPLPIASFSAPEENICEGEIVTYVSDLVEDGASYTWDFGANASPSTATGAGPHTVTYTLPASQNGDLSSTATVTATRM